MGSSWHAFLYGSFDAAGVMTVDKPPLASWVQVAFVKVFGYGSWGLLLPQALMGAASVALVYDLVRRPFGRAAGTVAGLVLALTPIAVAVSRHNNPDALLVLCSVAAVWFCVRALEDGRTRWLVLSGVAVGLGFETKMAVALMVVPGIVAAYLWIAPRGLRAAVGQVAAFTGAAVAVGGRVAAAAGADAVGRPAVGVGHRRQQHLVADLRLQRPRPAGGPVRRPGRAWPAGPAAAAGGGAGSMFGGPTGVTRLVESSLGGQAGWLLGAALVGGVAVVLASRLRRSDVRSGWIILVGGAFLTCAVAFSTAKGIFHPYYVSLLAPFTAALVGALVPHVTGGGMRARVLACLGVAGARGHRADGAAQPARRADLAAPRAVRGRRRPGGHAGRRPARPGAPRRARGRARPGAAGARGLVGPDARPRHQRHLPRRRPADHGHGRRPRRRWRHWRPRRRHGRGGGGGPFGGNSQTLTQAVAYARANGGGAVATGSQQGAAGPIIDSGADVAAIGGFSGRESQVDAKWLAEAVRDGRVRWVLADQGGMGGPQDSPRRRPRRS